MNNFIRSYEIILNHLQGLKINSTPFKQVRQPKLDNIELIAMNFTAEYMGVDSECQLFRVIKGSFLEPLIATALRFLDPMTAPIPVRDADLSSWIILAILTRFSPACPIAATRILLSPSSSFISDSVSLMFLPHR